MNPPQPSPKRRGSRSGEVVREQFADAQIADFLRRSYFAVDGLWFVKTEERHGFDEAMDVDEAIWDVMSKIQARKAKELLGISGDSLEDLGRAFQLKLAAEGYEFDVEFSNGEVMLKVRTCPWYEALKSNGRTQLAETIADRICAREFGGWIKEFSPDIEFQILGRLCVESDCREECRMVFRRR